MSRKSIQNGFFIIGIILNSVSALSLIFGYRIRELWPTTITMYEVGIPAVIGIVGVTFFGLGGMFFAMRTAKRKIIE
jgi:hypothetical protein